MNALFTCKTITEKVFTYYPREICVEFLKSVISHLQTRTGEIHDYPNLS